MNLKNNDEIQELLFVDDDILILNGINRLFRQHKVPWKHTLARGVDDALAVLQHKAVDAVISDISMPVRNGLELLDTLRSSKEWKDLPVVMMTGMNNPELRSKALNLGATDLLYKPILPMDLLARIRSVLHAKRYNDEIKLKNSHLLHLIQKHNETLESTRLEMIWRLARAAEFRSNETGFHIIRVGYYAKFLSESIGMDKAFTERIFLTSPLHDLGKIGIPDSILLKEGRLSESEWEIMKTHCTIGEDLLKSDCFDQDNNLTAMDFSISKNFNKDHNPFLQMGAEIAAGHHEQWNGTGYPYGKKQNEIPLSARIVTICDVYDALRSKRAYKPEMKHDETIALMRNESSCRFDPAIFLAFERSLSDFRDIYHQYKDLGHPTRPHNSP